MGIADELQKLEQLRQSGSLTDTEFAQAKIRLLESPSQVVNADLGLVLEDQLAQVRFQNELARIDREWDIERRQYQIVGRYGRIFTPTIGTGIATAVAGTLFGLIWTFIALMVVDAAKETGFVSETFSSISTVLPIVGILMIGIALWRGLYCALLAHNHKVALRKYQQRRLAVVDTEPVHQT